MPDNTTLPGTGDVIADEAVTINSQSVKVQLVKIALGAFDAYDMDLDSGQQTKANSLPVVLPSDQTVPVSGVGTNSVTATLTVTNGAYSIADVAGGLITFANAVSANGKSSIINSIKLAGVAAIPYELWFFSSDIATPRADNAVFGLAAADGLIFLGAVPINVADYNAAQTAFNNATIRAAGLQVKAGAGTTTIYAYLKCLAATSPATTTIYLTVDFEYIN